MPALNRSVSRERKTLTVEELAKELGIGLNLAYEGLTRGELPGRKVGGRWIIPRVQVEVWLAGN